MSDIFLKVFNMSITASWLVLAIVILRFMLKKAPKWMTCLLWGVVALRLVMPLSFESLFSLIPSAEPIPQDIAISQAPAINSGIPAVDDMLNPVITQSFAPEVGASANPLQILLFAASGIWIIGMAAMLLCSAVSYARLHRKVQASLLYRDHIFYCDAIDLPFILGIRKPKIYIPSGISEEHMQYVIAHEEAHIKRLDHRWKPLGFALLAVYWFNPFIWVAYSLFCRDIEKACDEKVIRDMNRDDKKGYSEALVSCSVRRRRIMACPLAFGEGGVKERIKAVLNYKKPAFWVIMLAAVVCIAVAVCFLTNPHGGKRVDERLEVFIDCQIAEHFESEHSSDYYRCLDFQVLDIEKSGDTATAYLWVLYQEYSCDSELKVESGSHLPTVITAKKVKDYYELVEYWTPRDGSDYVNDIREKFPAYLWDRALDSQRYMEEQLAECERMAKRHFGVSTSYVSGVEEPETVMPVNTVPELTVICGNASQIAWKGAYSWTYDAGDGTWKALNADSPHPLDCLEHIGQWHPNAADGGESQLTATLDFDIVPDQVLVNCWKIENGEGKAQKVEEDGFNVRLHEGGIYLYEVIATWDSGTVHYAFCTDTAWEEATGMRQFYTVF